MKSCVSVGYMVCNSSVRFSDMQEFTELPILQCNSNLETLGYSSLYIWEM